MLIAISIFVLLLAILFKRRSANFGYLMFVASFLFPQIIVNAIFRTPVATSAGGSPIYNIAIIGTIGFFLFATLVLLDDNENHSKFRLSSYSVSQYFVLIAWVILLLLKYWEAISTPTPILPLSEIILYSPTIFIAQKLEVKRFFDALLSIQFSLTVLIFLSFIFKYQWTAFDEYSNIFEAGIYISPLNHYFGLPIRVSGPFGSAQALGIFCGLAFSVALFSEQRLSKKHILYAFSFATLGTFSGSRTYYLVLLSACLLKIMSGLGKRFSIDSFFVAIFAMTTGIISMFQFILPKISDQNNVAQVGGRSLLWETILKHWNDGGLIGNGPNTIRDYMITNTGKYAYGHAHNTALQYLWDFGIIGILTYLTVIVSLLLSLKSRVETKNSLFFILPIFLVIQSETTFQMEFSMFGLDSIMLLVAACGILSKSQQISTIEVCDNDL
jgi:hypothetical protein